MMKDYMYKTSSDSQESRDGVVFQILALTGLVAASLLLETYVMPSYLSTFRCIPYPGVEWVSKSIAALFPVWPNSAHLAPGIE